MSHADSVPLEVQRTDDGVVIATLSNGKVNALSNRVLDAIADAATEWAKNPPGAVVLTSISSSKRVVGPTRLMLAMTALAMRTRWSTAKRYAPSPGRFAAQARRWNPSAVR